MSLPVDLTSSKNPIVLVIEDETSYRELLCKIVTDCLNGQATGVDNAYDAYSCLYKNGDSIDCVLCDFQMPEFNGLDFLQDVRKGLLWKKRFVVMTSVTDEVVRETAFERGASDFFLKTEFADIQELTSKISAILTPVMTDIKKS